MFGQMFLMLVSVNVFDVGFGEMFLNVLMLVWSDVFDVGLGQMFLMLVSVKCF